MKPNSLEYRSEIKSWSNGGTLTFQKWVPRKSPSGKRIVIDGFTLVANLSDISVANTAIQGADLYRAWARIQVRQIDGVYRWNLRGDETRNMLYELEGADRVHEHADSGTTNNQAIVVKAYIPMRKRFMKRGKDFALPAEILDNVSIDCGSTTELGVSTGTITITAASYYVIAHCREERSIELKAVDEVKSTPLSGTDGLTFKAAGRLHGLFFMARGASGGASLANLTDVRIDHLMPVAFNRVTELKEAYLRDRGTVTNLASTDGGSVRNDPVAGNIAAPVIWTNEDTSSRDGLLVDDVTVYLTNSVPSLLAVTRTVKPKSEAVREAVRSAWGLDEGDFRVKTAGKTRRAPGQWRAEERAFLVESAAIPGLAA